MDLREFGIRTLESVVAFFPAFVWGISVISLKLNKVKQITSAFPQKVEDTKETFKDSFNILKGNVESLVKERVSEIESIVRRNMNNMQQELIDYKNELIKNTKQLNVLVKENKFYIDVISELLSGNPKLIKEGIASKVTDKIESFKKELEEVPENIIPDYKKIETTLKDIITLIGENNFEGLLKRLGYEKRKEEELQIKK